MRYFLTGALCFVFSFSPALAQDCPDKDADGYTAQYCGGDDCDDGDSTIHPAADDIPNDGIDQNCDGVDFTQNCDQDGDGFLALVCGGDDCNDLDASVHVGADDPDGDGIDQDCSGDASCEPTVWVQGPRACEVVPAMALSWLVLPPVLMLRRRRGVQQ